MEATILLDRGFFFGDCRFGIGRQVSAVSAGHAAGSEEVCSFFTIKNGGTAYSPSGHSFILFVAWSRKEDRCWLECVFSSRHFKPDYWYRKRAPGSS